MSSGEKSSAESYGLPSALKNLFCVSSRRFLKRPSTELTSRSSKESPGQRDEGRSINYRRLNVTSRVAQSLDDIPQARIKLDAIPRIMSSPMAKEPPH